MNDKKNREPMVIALATGKGGSMKTTSAVFLACALVDGSDRCRPRNVPGLWRGTMNRIMLLGLLVCISRVALCGVMGVMAETVARRAGSSSLRGLCRLCVVAYALVLVASFAPMDSAQTVVHRAVPLLFLVPNLFIWISMRPSGASMRGTRRRNDADGSADSISCEPMNKENK